MTNTNALEYSIPANNQKIIEIYNRLRSKHLIVNKNYQRKLVWKPSHKINFIDTILNNFPFPEVYLAPGVLDQVNLILVDEIVDGQQRLTTIQEYIEGNDIFAVKNSKIKRFLDLLPEEKNKFLNYEVSVRYLKNVSPEQVREIFQRINRTDYALNTAERQNAQWGDSEFVCFAKQIIEPNFESDSVELKIPKDVRMRFLEFFHGGDENDEGIFTNNDISRMFALQYIMSLVVTMESGEYFSRNEKINQYIVDYNAAFPQGADLQHRLEAVIDFIKQMALSRESRWYKKANLFSLIVELDKCELEAIDAQKLGSALNSLDRRALADEYGLEHHEDKLTAEEIKYFGYAREAVNQKSAREFRGHFLQNIIQASSKEQQVAD